MKLFDSVGYKSIDLSQLNASKDSGGVGMTAFPLEAYRLQPWEEARGPLHDLQDLNGCLVAHIGPAVVALPEDLRDRLQTLIGCKVGVLRTDTDFRVRSLGVNR